MLTNIYLQTTNPNLKIQELFTTKLFYDILFSIFLHILIYTFFCNIIYYIFYGYILNYIINFRLIISLFIIMFFGYIGRVLYVKDIYYTYNKNINKTREHIDKFFISWIFLS